MIIQSAATCDLSNAKAEKLLSLIDRSSSAEESFCLSSWASWVALSLCSDQ